MHAKRLFVPILVIILLTTLFAGLVSISVTAQTNTAPFTAKSNVAADKVQASQKKHVIFRDDDLEPFVNLETVKSVNQAHIDENVPVTLGVIAHPDTSVEGNELLMDESMLDYLRSVATNPLFEFAQHGYTHTDNGVGASSVGGGYFPRSSVGLGEPSVYWRPTADRLIGAQLVGTSEFEGRPYEDQYNAIKQGWGDINEALGVTPTTFIPPWNLGDANTLKAAHAVGHTLYSTGPDDISGVSEPGITVQAAPLCFPYEWPNNNNDWVTGMRSFTSYTDDVLDAASGGENIIIFYHYWAFEKDDGSLDPARVVLFEQFIEHLKDRGDVDFTTLNNQNALPVSAATNVTLTASDTNPGVGQDVTFTGNLGVARAGEPVEIWYVEDLYRSDDATVTTNANGTFSFTRSWDSTGERLYYATFYGGDDYIQSLSPSVNIDVVTKQSTTLTAAPTTTPAVNQNFTINGTLKVGTTPIAGATIQLQKNVSGTWTNVAGKTNRTQSGGTYNITASEPTAATYQYRTTYAGTAPYKSATSNVVYVTVQAGAGVWGTWASLSGYLTSSPAAVSWADGRIDVFARGSDNALWHRSYNNNAWSTWESLGGQLASSPAAVSWADGRIDVFARGSDNALWHRSYTNNAWSTWESLGGQLASTTGPAASSQAAGHLDVFVIGSDQALWHRTYA